MTSTLKITFGQATDHREAARERLRRAEAGDDSDAVEQDAGFILNFESFDDIERLMRGSNLALLEVIVNEQPGSIRQTAEAVDRDYREVHRNLNELASLGVIEFEQEGASKQPVLRGGADTIDLSFTIGRDSIDGQPDATA